MERAERFEYKVGIFVALGLIVLMVSISMLGGGWSFFQEDYTIRARFPSVQGLVPGSVVSLAGLPIGNISDIEFAPEGDRLEVTMAVDPRYKNRVREGATAEIRTLGALGDKFVYIKPGPPEAPAVPDGGLIQTKEGDIFELLTSTDNGGGNLVELIKQMQALVATLNAEGRPGRIMENAVVVTDELRRTLKQIRLLASDLRSDVPKAPLESAIKDLASILEKIDKGEGTLGAFINDPAIHQRLKDLIGVSPRTGFMKSILEDTIEETETETRTE